MYESPSAAATDGAPLSSSSSGGVASAMDCLMDWRTSDMGVPASTFSGAAGGVSGGVGFGGPAEILAESVLLEDLPMV